MTIKDFEIPTLKQKGAEKEEDKKDAGKQGADKGESPDKDADQQKVKEQHQEMSDNENSHMEDLSSEVQQPPKTDDEKEA